MAQIRSISNKVRSRIRRSPNVAKLVESGLKIEDDVWFGPGTVLDPDFAFLISIKAHTTFGPNVTVLAHDASMRKLAGYTRVAPVKIGSYVFVGCGAILLPGTTIGDRSVIAAGAVVRGVVEPGTIVGGNPAIAIGQTDDFVARHREKVDAFVANAKSMGVEPHELNHLVLKDKLNDLLVDGVGYVL